MKCATLTAPSIKEFYQDRYRVSKNSNMTSTLSVFLLLVSARALYLSLSGEPLLENYTLHLTHTLFRENKYSIVGTCVYVVCCYAYL